MEVTMARGDGGGGGGDNRMAGYGKRRECGMGGDVGGDVLFYSYFIS